MCNHVIKRIYIAAAGSVYSYLSFHQILLIYNCPIAEHDSNCLDPDKQTYAQNVLAVDAKVEGAELQKASSHEEGISPCL